MADYHDLSYNNYNNEDEEDIIAKIRKSGWFAIFCGIIPFTFLMIYLVISAVLISTVQIVEILNSFIQIANPIFGFNIGVSQLLVVYIGLRSLVRRTKIGEKLFCYILFGNKYNN